MSTLSVTIDGHTFVVDLDLAAGGELAARVDGEPVRVVATSLADSDQLEWLSVGGRVYEVVLDRDLRWMRSRAGLHRLEVRDLGVRTQRPVSGDGRIKAPIPGVIARLLVEPGQTVAAGQPLLVLEAMKMENEITAHKAGKVTTLAVEVGGSINAGDPIATIE